MLLFHSILTTAMPRIPDEFRNEFDKKGDTFFEIAEILYTHPDRQFTQDEVAEIIGRSNTTVSNHTSEMVDADWLVCQENQTTYGWNIDVHNPASTEGLTAVRRFYVDFWNLLKKHTNTLPGTFAIIGFTFILTAVVLFAFFLGFSLGITQESSVPSVVYLAIAISSFLGGVIMTFISPLQATLHRFVRRIVPANLFQNKDE